MADAQRSETASTWRPRGMADLSADEQLAQLTRFAETLGKLTALRLGEQHAAHLAELIERARRLAAAAGTNGAHGAGSNRSTSSARARAELAQDAEAAMSAVLDEAREQIEAKEWDDLDAADRAIDEFQALMDALPPNLNEATLPPIVFLDGAARWESFDRCVRARLGIGGEEFLRRLDAGEYDPDVSHSDVVFLEAMRPFDR